MIHRMRLWAADKIAAAGLFVLGVAFYWSADPEQEEYPEPTGHLG